MIMHIRRGNMQEDLTDISACYLRRNLREAQRSTPSFRFSFDARRRGSSFCRRVGAVDKEAPADSWALPDLPNGTSFAAKNCGVPARSWSQARARNKWPACQTQEGRQATGSPSSSFDSRLEGSKPAERHNTSRHRGSCGRLAAEFSNEHRWVNAKVSAYVLGQPGRRAEAHGPSSFDYQLKGSEPAQQFNARIRRGSRAWHAAELWSEHRLVYAKVSAWVLGRPGHRAEGAWQRQSDGPSG
jgi:hypothetical protein